MDHLFKDFIEFITILLLFYVLDFGSQDMWDLSSPTRDGTCTPCTGRRSLNHWTTGEVPTVQVLTSRWACCPDNFWLIGSVRVPEMGQEAGCPHLVQQLLHHRCSSLPCGSNLLQQKPVFRLQEHRGWSFVRPQSIFTGKSHWPSSTLRSNVSSLGYVRSQRQVSVSMCVHVPVCDAYV